MKIACLTHKLNKWTSEPHCLSLGRIDAWHCLVWYFLHRFTSPWLRWGHVQRAKFRGFPEELLREWLQGASRRTCSRAGRLYPLSKVSAKPRRPGKEKGEAALGMETWLGSPLSSCVRCVSWACSSINVSYYTAPKDFCEASICACLGHKILC